MIETKGILLAGVGGQGILRASDILCRVFMEAGMDVKKSEVHGMAQRGGCVTSHVRYGQYVHSPLSKKSDIDILLSFEKMDTLRYLDYMKEDGKIIINREEIYPPSINQGDAFYPENIVEKIGTIYSNCRSIDAISLAHQAGNIRTVNAVMLGALSSYLDLSIDLWQKVLQDSFPAKLINPNLEAFLLGRHALCC